jgi:uncharacterized membrane protein HdeD (DUF308 family)
MASPDKKDRKRPVELLVLSAILALFAGLIVLMATRSPILSLIFFGIAFIVSLVVLAMLALAIKPTGEERADLAEQDRDENGGRGH